MNRLTTRVEDKVYYSKGKYPPTTLCAEMETSEVRECMMQLAAYEDTGLTPEELTKLYKMIDITDLREHISELLDLEQQGRLKRFHKIGDEVYILYNASDDDKSPLHVVNKCKVKYQYSDWLTDESDMSIVYGLEGIEPFSNCTIIDFEVWEDGIFSTKEEAKKALEEMNGTPRS